MIEVGPDLGESPIVVSTLTVGAADINGFAIFDITDAGNTSGSPCILNGVTSATSNGAQRDDA